MVNIWARGLYVLINISEEKNISVHNFTTQDVWQLGKIYRLVILRRAKREKGDWLRNGDDDDMMIIMAFGKKSAP